MTPLSIGNASIPLPPCNTEAEQALLGAILVNNVAYGRVAKFLAPEHFGNAVHGRIYAAAAKLIERGQIANPVTLKNLFDQDGALVDIGGAQYLAQLVESAVTIINAEHYGRTIHDLHFRRELITIGQDIVADAFRQDLDDLAREQIERAEAKLSELGSRIGIARPVIRATPFTWTEPSALPPRAWVYGRHLIRGYVSADVAPAGVGKSSLVVSEVLAMVTGKALLGDEPAGRLRVWLVNLEDPADELRRRIAATALHFDIAAADIGDRLYLDSGRDTEMIIAFESRDGIQIATPVVRAIRRTIAENHIDVLIVDPFVAAHAVGENDNIAIAAVARQLANIAEATGCAIGLVHHSRKGGIGQVVTVDDARGASALIAAVRSARTLNVMTKEEAERVGIDNPRSYFTVANGKSNLAPPPDKAVWRHIASVPLGNGVRAGLGGDHVGVAEAWAWPDPFDDVSPAAAKAVQRRIAEGEWRADHRSPAWAGIAVSEVLNLDLTEPACRASARSMLKTWIGTGALREVERLDARRKPRRFVEVAEWLP